MTRTKWGTDLAKQAESFDLALFKMMSSRIAERFGVSEKTVQRWVKAERARRHALATPSVREEVLLQVDQALTAAWMNYEAQKVGTPARGKALKVVITVLKLRAEFRGLGIDHARAKAYDYQGTFLRDWWRRLRVVRKARQIGMTRVIGEETV